MAFRRGHRSDRIPAHRCEDLRNAVNPFHADIVGSRTWPRLHLVVDLTTAEILSSKITTHCTRDSTPVPDLLAPITRGLASVRADGAYDSASVYYAIENHQSAPPYSDSNSDPAGAQYEDQRRPRRRQRPAHCQHQAYCSPRPTPLAETIRIHTSQSGRSLVETAMSRIKNEFGGALRSRPIQTQETEVRIDCSILNTMTRLAMPDGHCVSRTVPAPRESSPTIGSCNKALSQREKPALPPEAGF